MFDFDLFVIGGGSGGIRAARVASQKGFKVGLAEEYRYGGTCVIRGCVPKKLMVYAADFRDQFEDSRAFGWSFDQSSFDFQLFQQKKDAEINRLEEIYQHNLNLAKVSCFRSRAKLADPHCIKLSDGAKYSAKMILIATGGYPFIPEFEGSDLVMTSNDIFQLKELPKNILIYGGSYIACEFAGILNGMGSNVSQYYRGDQILRWFDHDIRSHLQQAMCNRGIDIKLNQIIQKITKEGQSLVVETSDGEARNFDAVIYATGRKPNTKNLNLEEVGVSLNRSGAIEVDEYSQTGVPSIFAIGDVTNRLNLTPVAIREAMQLIATICDGIPTPVDHQNVPTAVFTRPEIGTVGLSEEMARKNGEIEIYKTKFRPMPYMVSGREEQNLMKIIVDKSSRKVLGVHIVAPGAAEMIQMVAIPVKMGTTKEQFDQTVAVHPTAAEELVTMQKPSKAS